MNVNSTTQSKIQNALYGEDVKDEHGNDVHVLGVNDIKGALGINGAKFYGLKGDERNNLADARNTTVSLSVPVEKIDKQGIHTLINGNASLTATENLNVTATEKSDISAKGVNVTAGGGASVNVTDAIIHTNYDTDVTMDNATLVGNNVNVKDSLNSFNTTDECVVAIIIVFFIPLNSRIKVLIKEGCK